MSLTLEPLSEHTADELLQFELDNRSFFESMIPRRGDDYYNPQVFRTILRGLIQERINGTAFMYMIHDEERRLVGRIHLMNVNPETKTAEVGYRIGEKFGNHGYATEAVHLLLQEAARLGLRYVQASTLDVNGSSQTVLIKNNFTLIGRDPEQLEWNGMNLDFLIYQYECPSPAAVCENESSSKG
jgi:ribosomal-protein-alanine N-acetyltransferase